MVRLILCIFVVAIGLLHTRPAIAQESGKKSKANFSDDWVQVNPPRPTSGTADPLVRKTYVLRVDHDDPELRETDVLVTERLDAQGSVISKTETTYSTRTLYTDKRGETNIGQRTNTQWHGNDITTVVVDKKHQIYLEAKLSVSKDLSELTVTTQLFLLNYSSASARDVFPPPPTTTKRVYRKR